MKNAKNKLLPRMRFSEVNAANNNEDDNPDTTVIDIKFPDESNNFLAVFFYLF